MKSMATKKSKFLLVTILVLTLIVSYAVPMTVFADDVTPPEQQQVQQDTSADIPTDQQETLIDQQDPPSVPPVDLPADPQDSGTTSDGETTGEVPVVIPGGTPGAGPMLMMPVLINTPDPDNGNPGAIWTSDEDGNVNINLYDSKQDVYLNGGPKGGGGGLPDGAYYIKVTTPNGDLLGYNNNNTVTVADGIMPSFNLWNFLLKASDDTTGYDTTTNNGGEYKVWASKNLSFSNADSKTDNFKVKEPGAIKVVKTMSDDTSPEGIVFTLHHGRTTTTGTTDDDGIITFNDLRAGSDYWLEESVPDGYTTSLTNARITVTAGETITVRVLNIKTTPPTSGGAIQVVKTMSDDTSPEGIVFTLHHGETSTPGTTDGYGIITFSELAPGSDYWLEETVPSGYTTNLTDANITVTEGQTTTVNVLNTLIPSPPSKGAIEVVKTMSDGTSPEGIVFTLYRGDATVQQGTTDNDGIITFSELDAGSDYWLSETVPSGYTTSLTNATITVTAGETTTVNVLNTKTPPLTSKGAIEVVKTMSDGTSPAGIVFTLHHGDATTQGTTDNDGKITFSGLDAGSDYWLSETVPSGYTTSLTNATITVTAGETTTVNVLNTKTSTPQTPRGSRNSGGSTPVVIPEEPTPAAPVVLPDEQVPAGPLPQTGGVPALLLYGLGTLLAGGGFVLRRKDKNQ